MSPTFFFRSVRLLCSKHTGAFSNGGGFTYVLANTAVHSFSWQLVCLCKHRTEPDADHEELQESLTPLLEEIGGEDPEGLCKRIIDELGGTGGAQADQNGGDTGVRIMK